MHPRRSISRGWSWLMLGLFALVTRDAAAIDVIATSPPAAVADGVLTIGGRSLRLPEGNWTYAARVEGSISRGHAGKMAPHYTVYAMDVKGNQMRSAVVLRMPPNSVVVGDWSEQPCKQTPDGALFKDDFGTDYKFPACLVVYKRRGHFSAATLAEPFYGQAQRWATAQGIQFPGPMYEIAYVKFASNDFGLVRVYLPQQAFGSDNEAVSWAKGLPGQVQKLFENRESQATLAPFPITSRQ